MIKRFIKDNRGQVLYAVIVTVMFMGVVSMITMGLTLSNYRAALQKQQHVTDYYAADAAAELIRLGSPLEDVKTQWNVSVSDPETVDGVSTYTITYGTVTIVTAIQGDEFISWEVSYHAVQTENDEANPVQ
jgi:hypothetical protein